jgi:exopolysaccharide biosynthesis polyprenyl glycosylphosphotransferase
MSRRISPLSVLLFIADLALIPVGLFLATRLRATVPLGTAGALPQAAVQAPPFVYGIAVLSWAIGLIASGAYDPQRALRWFNEAWRVAAGSVVATILMAGMLYMSYRELSRLQFAYFFAVALVLLLGYRAGLRVYYRASGKGRPGGRTRVLIIGAGELGERAGKALQDHSRWGYEPVGYLDDDTTKQAQVILGMPVLGTVGRLEQVIRDAHVEEVWIALPARAHERLEQVVTALEPYAVRTKVVPDYYSMALVRANPDRLGGLPIIGLRDPLIEGLPRLVKRAFDLTFSLALLLPALPILGLIALLIRLDSRGPALFRQPRVGENGRIFQMYKFRSMIERAEPAGSAPAQGVPPLHKKRDDPRVTRVGRWLRRYSLDELPQLFNVLKGDMSLVGPRPEMPWLVDRYEAWQRKRFAVPQGITGWWQINGRSDKPMHLNTQDDLYYVYNYSILLDFWILLKTPLAVMRGKGAF